MDDSGGALFWAFALAIIAACCLGLAIYQGDKLDPVIGFILGTVGIVAAIMSGLLALYWVLEEVAPRLVYTYETARYAYAVTRPEVVLLRKLAELPADHLALVTRYVPEITALGGNTGPVYSLRCGDKSVSLDFARQYVAGSTEDKGTWYLRPVRNYSGQERADVQTLVEYFVTVGLARPAAGNNSAAWVDWRAALRWLDLEDVR